MQGNNKVIDFKLTGSTTNQGKRASWDHRVAFLRTHLKFNEKNSLFLARQSAGDFSCLPGSRPVRSGPAPLRGSDCRPKQKKAERLMKPPVERLYSAE